MAVAAPWIVAGRYEVGEIIGRGGYGTVRRGIDRKTGQPVAMKLLSADAGKDPHLVERMLREQQAMVAMAGTCAVSAVDLCRLASGAPCLVMEWLDGCDLEHQLNDWEVAGERPSIPLVLELVRPLADTLQRAHELGIVHRDIKPANVFLTAGAKDAQTAQNAVRLLDFGLSRMRTDATLTAVGMVMGSPSYIPPETWRGNSALIDHRADLYSLAVIVFRMLAGRLPFETTSLLEKHALVTTGERPSVREFRPELPVTIDEWMNRALAIEREQRFQSARAFHDALTLALSGAAFQPLDEEVSGVRDRATLGSAESRSVLALAWQRATTLLQRFIGQKPAQVLGSSAAPAQPQPPATPIDPPLEPAPSVELNPSTENPTGAKASEPAPSRKHAAPAARARKAKKPKRPKAHAGGNAKKKPKVRRKKR